MISGKDGLLEAMTEAFVMEKGTAEFYGSAAEKSGSEEAQKAFRELSAWEEEHMHYIEHLYHSFMEDRETLTFEEFEKKASADTTEGGIPIENLEARIERHDFKTDMEALDIALDIEARAYGLYQKISREAEDSNARVFMQEMAEREQEHIQYIKDLKNRI